MEMFADVDLSPSQAEAVARVMLAVARADGAVDPRELALIEEIAPVGPDAPELSPGDAASQLPLGTQRELAVRAALLVALVDRSYSDAERGVVSGYAAAFGVGEEELERHASAVKAFFLSPLLGLSNAEAVAEVSAQIKL